MLQEVTEQPTRRRWVLVSYTSLEKAGDQLALVQGFAHSSWGHPVTMGPSQTDGFQALAAFPASSRMARLSPASTQMVTAD